MVFFAMGSLPHEGVLRIRRMEWFPRDIVRTVNAHRR
jgi:hypothetical protein